MRPWEGGTLGYAAQRGGVEARGNIGEGWGRQRGGGERRDDGRRRGGGERKERATPLRGVRSGRVICEDAPAAVITWDLVALSLPREREDMM